MQDLPACCRINGSTERTLAVLSRGDADKDERTTDHLGSTVLMLASLHGFPRVVRILQEGGAKRGDDR